MSAFRGQSRLRPMSPFEGWPRETLVLTVYPVDNLDLRRAVTDH
jgi:hypothetical protein